jgi:membrane fusion protein (multidrug efflux system)
MSRAMRIRPSLRHAALPLLILLAGCGETAPPPAPPPAEVGVVTLVAEPVTLSTELAGRTSAYMVSEVRPQVAGIVKARLFTEGTVVRAGQPLYSIDSSLYGAARDEAAAQVASAQATLVAAQAKAGRYRGLVATEAVSKQEADDVTAAAGQARAALQSARASLQTARINLGFTRIVAPISGRIGRSSVTPGALVTASQTEALATIQRLDPIFVDITQSSAALLALRQSLASGGTLPASASIRLKLEDGSDFAQTGTVEFAEAVVDPDTGTVTLRARFANPQGLLLPGMFVRAVAPQSVVPNAILVPQAGISRDPRGAATALVVGADNKVEMRTVTAAQAIGDKWLITAGLKAGERVIVEGTGKARAGAVVKPVAFQPAKAK